MYTRFRFQALTKSLFEMFRLISFLVFALVLLMDVLLIIGYPCITDTSDLDNTNKGYCYLKTVVKRNNFLHRLNNL